MASKYPYAIDDTSSLPITTDSVTAVKAEVVNNLRNAIIAIEAELGLDPSREYSTVRARLDAMSAILAALQDTTGGADLTSLPPVPVTKSAAQVGNIALAARSDHKHDISTASATTIGTTNSEGNSSSLARADHTHAVSGLNILSQTRGSILYYNGTSWVILNPSTDGYVLTTHSTGADPTWTAPSGGSGGASLTNSAPVNVTKSVAVVGVATTAARADHKHDVTTAAPSAIGNANTEGSATSLSRSDHIHALGGTVGGDLSGTLPNPTVVNFHIPGATTNSILYYNGTNWTILNAGQDGYVLTTHSVGAPPNWTSLPDGVGLGVVSPIDVDKNASIVGVSARAAHEDHKHSVVTATAVSVGATNAEGTATGLARADHTHAVTDLKMTSQSQGSVLYFNGTNWVILAPSTDGAVLTTHSVGQNPTWNSLNSSSIINVSTVTGATVTNALNTINTYINALPTIATVAPVNVSKSIAVLGASTKAAREDHKHDISTATAVTVGTVNSEGVATTLARSDHTHIVNALSITGQVQGDILYFNGTSWVRLAPSTDGFVLTTHSVGQNPTWSPTPSGVTLSGLLPVDVDANPAAVGTGLFAARNDHKHNIATGIGTSIGAINALGSSISLSRSDHKHAVVDLAISGQAQGDLIYFNGSNWVRLAAGSSGFVLTSNGVGLNPTWTAAPTLTTAAPVNVNVSTALIGIATTAARSDHKHNIDVATAVSVGALNSAGSSSSLSRSDHTHAVVDLAISGQTQGSVLYFNGTNWVRLAPSTDGFVLTTHSTGANPTWSAAPTGVTLSGVAPVNVDANTAAVGVATTAARSDHKHNINTGVAVNISNVNAQGTATTLARSDHTHAGVYSFNGRLGSVAPIGGDYNSTQITNISTLVPGGNVTATTDYLYNRDVLEYKNILNISSNRTLQAFDAGCLISITNNNCVITIPENTTVAFPIGSRVSVVCTGVTSTMAISVAAGVTLLNNNVLIDNRLNKIFELTKIGINTWIITAVTSESSEIFNGSSVPGSTVTGALNYLLGQTAGLVNGMSIPIIPLMGTSGWWGGVTDYYYGNGVGGAMGISIPLYSNIGLTNIAVIIEPALGHTGLPAGMPFIQLWIGNYFTQSNMAYAGGTADPSNFASYPYEHTIVLTTGAPIYSNSYTASLRINDENGLRSLPNLKLKAVYAYYS